MIDVSVSKEHGIYICRVIGEGFALVLFFVLPLMKAAVDKHFPIFGLNHVVGSCYFTCCA